jgi:hypothetical protein
VAAAIQRVHEAPGAHQPRGLVGAQDGLVDNTRFEWEEGG